MRDSASSKNESVSFQIYSDNNDTRYIAKIKQTLGTRSWDIKALSSEDAPAANKTKI